MTSNEPRTQLVEVHGSNQPQHSVVAKRTAEKIHPGLKATDAKPSGERCSHGFIVWLVELEP